MADLRGPHFIKGRSTTISEQISLGISPTLRCILAYGKEGAITLNVSLLVQVLLTAVAHQCMCPLEGRCLPELFPPVQSILYILQLEMSLS